MKKIIIVDRIRQQLNLEIGQECGEVEAITAYSNEGALDLHWKQKVDLIITELYGSGMKAHHLCSAIREDPGLRKVSIIVFCRNNEVELGEGRQCRANAVMTLPVRPALLRSTVQKFLRVPERADCRIPFIARSACLLGHSRLECEVENISINGMLIGADAALKKGDSINCSLTLPPAMTVETQAKVTRVVKTAPDQNKYGLRFSYLDPAGRRAIEALIQRRQ